MVKGSIISSWGNRFSAIDCKGDKIGVLDETDKVVEYYTPSELKSFLKDGVIINGVTLAEDINPIFTLDGLEFDLAYKNHNSFGKWTVAVLKEGDKFGRTLASTVKTDTVMFYSNTSKGFSKPSHPLGQFVSSYRLVDIVNHRGVLKLQADVPAWTIDAKTMDEINKWLRNFV